MFGGLTLEADTAHPTSWCMDWLNGQRWVTVSKGAWASLSEGEIVCLGSAIVHPERPARGRRRVRVARVSYHSRR